MALFDFDDSFDPPVESFPAPESTDGGGTSSSNGSWGLPGDVWGVLRGAGDAVAQVAKTVTDFQRQRNQLSLDSARNSLALFQAQAGLQLARTQTQGALDLERLRGATEVAKAQTTLREAMGLQGIQDRVLSILPGGASGNYNFIMLALAAAGVYLAWKGMRK